MIKLISRLLTEGLAWVRTNDDLHQEAKGHLSKLVHLRAGQKPISDARTATYVILSTGSGPGGRWFKPIRPDPFSAIMYLTQKRVTVGRPWPGSVSSESFRTRRHCYHARRMKVEKRKFDQALKKMLRAKPEPCGFRGMVINDSERS